MATLAALVVILSTTKWQRPLPRYVIVCYGVVTCLMVVACLVALQEQKLVEALSAGAGALFIVAFLVRDK
jgi:hypothetical protein